MPPQQPPGWQGSPGWIWGGGIGARPPIAPGGPEIPQPPIDVPPTTPPGWQGSPGWIWGGGIGARPPIWPGGLPVPPMPPIDVPPGGPGTGPPGWQGSPGWIWGGGIGARPPIAPGGTPPPPSDASVTTPVNNPPYPAPDGYTWVFGFLPNMNYWIWVLVPNPQPPSSPAGQFTVAITQKDGEPSPAPPAP